MLPKKFFAVPRPSPRDSSEEALIREEISKKIGRVIYFTSIVKFKLRYFLIEVNFSNSNSDLSKSYDISIPDSKDARIPKKFKLYTYISENELIHKHSIIRNEGTEDEIVTLEKGGIDKDSLEYILGISTDEKYEPYIKYNFETDTIDTEYERQNDEKKRSIHEGDMTMPLRGFAIGTWVSQFKFRRYWPPSVHDTLYPKLKINGKNNSLDITFMYDSKRRGNKFQRKIEVLEKTVIPDQNYIVRQGNVLYFYLSLSATPICNEKLDPKIVKTSYERVPFYAQTSKHLFYMYILARPVLVFALEIKHENLSFKQRQLKEYIIETYKAHEIKNVEMANPTDYEVLNYNEIFRKYKIKFGIQYGVLCLISQGIYSVFEIREEELKIISEKDPKFAEKALYYMTATERTQKEGIYETFKTEFEKYYQQYLAGILKDQEPENNEEDKKNKENYALIKRIFLTPALLVFRAPELDITNRVVRHLKNKAHYLMRLNLVNENFEQLQNIKNHMCEYYKEILGRGIPVGTKKYMFLAFSNSQLRGSSCWIFKETPKFPLKNLYEWMGDFRKEKNLAKYASRMGLAFSTTYKAAEIPLDCIIRIPDVESKTKEKDENGKEMEVKYCFSDGVGRISKSLMLEAVKILGEKYASAIQCRFAGCKGVFSIDPDPNLTKDAIFIRPSQIKFESKHPDIEIIGCSKFHYGHLNRQVILLLSTQKIEDAVFDKMLDLHINMLKSLVRGDVSEESQQIALDGCFQEVIDIVQRMMKSNFTPKYEPFLQSINEAIFHRSLKELRTKERILVKRSACLLGIMDETGILNYGEVYCRLSKNNDPDEKEGDESLQNGNYTIKGEVIISKNPCLFPGDIRVLTAIDHPKLRQYVNVVVFPSRGKRPHPNETSGSDLDGDVYFISWESLLLPKKENRVEPALFPSSKGKEEQITRKNIIEFFCNYMKGSNLGKIANAHLVFADLSAKKALDERCLELAKQHSIEVDFPKTGVSGVMRDDDHVKYYPDFMEKEDERTYESQTIIGKLYRRVKEIQTSGAIVEDITKSPIIVDKDLVIDGYEKYYGIAEQRYREYVTDISKFLKQFGITSEAELISGNMTELSKFHTVKKDNQDILERIQKSMTLLINDHQRRFNKDTNNKEEKQQKASAYYIVAYDIKGEYTLAGKKLVNKAALLAQQQELAKKNESEATKSKDKKIKAQARFLSFPWLIAGRYLCQIKHKYYEENNT